MDCQKESTILSVMSISGCGRLTAERVCEETNYSLNQAVKFAINEDRKNDIYHCTVVRRSKSNRILRQDGNVLFVSFG